MKGLIVWVWALAALLAGVFSYALMTHHQYAEAVQSLTETVDRLHGENQRLEAALRTRDKSAPKNPEPVSLRSLLGLGADPKSMSRPSEYGSVKEGGLTPRALEVITQALMQVRKQRAASQNDANEIAQLRRENELLRQELSALQTARAIQTSGQAAVTQVQAERRQVDTVVDSVRREFLTNPNLRHKLLLLESLSGLADQQEPALLSILGPALCDPSPEVREASRQYLSRYRGPELVPLIAEAMVHPDPQTRRTAVDLLENGAGPEVLDLFLLAISDAEEEVRSASLDKLENQPDEIQLAVYQTGMASPFSDVKTKTLSLMEFRGDSAIVDLVIKGLEDADPEFREQVNATLTFLVGKDFERYEDAKAWWLENKSQYDDNLIPTQTKVGPE
jgi:HEAT repeat protein